MFSGRDVNTQVKQLNERLKRRYFWVAEYSRIQEDTTWDFTNC